VAIRGRVLHCIVFCSHFHLHTPLSFPAPLSVSPLVLLSFPPGLWFPLSLSPTALFFFALSFFSAFPDDCLGYFLWTTLNLFSCIFFLFSPRLFPPFDGVPFILSAGKSFLYFYRPLFVDWPMSPLYPTPRAPQLFFAVAVVEAPVFPFLSTSLSVAFGLSLLSFPRGFDVTSQPLHPCFPYFCAPFHPSFLRIFFHPFVRFSYRLLVGVVYPRTACFVLPFTCFLVCVPTDWVCFLFRWWIKPVIF